MGTEAPRDDWSRVNEVIKLAVKNSKKISELV